MSQLILDVREPHEYKSGKVKGSINIPVMKLMMGLPKDLSEIPRDTEIIVYCRTGSRSSYAAQMLARFGFTNVIDGINHTHTEGLLS